MKSCLFSFFLILCSFKLAFSAGLKEGYYLGKTIDRDRVELHLRKHPSRESSYLALVVNEGGYGYTYRVDHYQNETYGMIPFKVLDSAMIGFDNPNPSLSLKVTYKKGRNVLQVVNNGELNKHGFKYTTMEFVVNKRKKSRWVKNVPGWFKYDSRREGITVGTKNNESESSFTANTSVLNGDYTLREVKPFLNLPLRLELASTGTNILDFAQGIIVFINGKNILGTKGMYFMKNDGRVFYFKKGAE